MAPVVLLDTVVPLGAQESVAVKVIVGVGWGTVLEVVLHVHPATAVLVGLGDAAAVVVVGLGDVAVVVVGLGDAAVMVVVGLGDAVVVVVVGLGDAAAMEVGLGDAAAMVVGLRDAAVVVVGLGDAAVVVVGLGDAAVVVGLGDEPATHALSTLHTVAAGRGSLFILIECLSSHTIPVQCRYMQKVTAATQVGPQTYFQADAAITTKQA